MARGRGKSENPVVNDYICARMRALFDRNMDSRKDFAARAGVTPPFISQLFSKDAQVGWGSVEGFARAFRTSVPELIAAAYDWDRRGRVFETREMDERYPNRLRAARFAEGSISDRAIREVLELDYQSPVDLSPVAWLKYMLSRDETIQLEAASTPAQREQQQAKRARDTDSAVETGTPRMPSSRKKKA